MKWGPWLLRSFSQETARNSGLASTKLRMSSTTSTRRSTLLRLRNSQKHSSTISLSCRSFSTKSSCCFAFFLMFVFSRHWM